MAEWDRRSFDGIAVSVPPGWSVRDDAPGVELVISAAVEDGFRSNVSITRGPAASADLQSTFMQQLAELRSVLTDSTLLDLEETQLGGFSAQRVLVAFRQGIYDLIMEQWMTLTNEGVAVVSACATTKAWEQEDQVLRRIVSSLRF